MFYGTTGVGLKCLDPLFFLMNPLPSYTIRLLDVVSGLSTYQDSEKSRLAIANYVQGEIGKALSFECQSSSTPQNSQENDDEEEEVLVQDLRVPHHWLLPSRALEESKWLEVTLHKWLDDEYCPEQTNVEISKVAAQSYYESLLEKQTDLGVILLNMARNLESISYKESFHGAFSSANAAVNLIVQRIELQAQGQLKAEKCRFRSNSFKPPTPTYLALLNKGEVGSFTAYDSPRNPFSPRLLGVLRFPIAFDYQKVLIELCKDKYQTLPAGSFCNMTLGLHSRRLLPIAMSVPPGKHVLRKMFGFAVGSLQYGR
ncbi:unnamed protein product [Dovyalis caffra]|uniref:Uncharacterized protein n=1 Tax=Dovyalis caffra TaxID=77055 RepID=A0AAV1SDI5_9ROSI|nr:unnamed protein product [Dovyalis caffra]